MLFVVRKPGEPLVKVTQARKGDAVVVKLTIAGVRSTDPRGPTRVPSRAVPSCKRR